MKLEAVIFDYDGTLVLLNIDFDALRREVERRLLGHGVELDLRNDQQRDGIDFLDGSLGGHVVLS